MRGSTLLAALMLCGCGSTPQQRADGYKRAIDGARVVCVAVDLDLAAPTDPQTIYRCQALESAK